MSSGRDPFAAERRALERTYGLALEGVGAPQVEGAFLAASADGVPRDPSDPSWLERVLDRLPIDESWLFRDEGLWAWLRDVEGPLVVERAMSAGRMVRALSIGCSSGQEAFTLAIVLQELLERAGFAPSALCQRVCVVGVDPSPSRIALAREGMVGAWSVQRCPPEWLRGRVRMEEPLTGRHRVDPAIRAACRFEVDNVLSLAAAGNARLGGYDLVLCRNVLIYFRQSGAERLAVELARGLDVGSLLVVSAAEAHLLQTSDRLGPATYLGAARVAGQSVRPETHSRSAKRHRSKRLPRARPARASSAPPPSASKVEARAAESGDARGSAIAEHLRVALEQSGAGNRTDTLREARAALFHDPGHLLSRMILGRELIAVDAPRGRKVLQDLLETAASLPPDADVPAAPGISVGQITAAVRLLLEKEGAG